jgi:hypothetical protein
MTKTTKPTNTIENTQTYYPTQFCRCPIDETALGLNLTDSITIDGKTKIKLCANCGILYYSPKIENKYFPKAYRNTIDNQNFEQYYDKEYTIGKRIYQELDKKGLLGVGCPYVVSIGCRTGGILSYFSKMDCQVAGCDHPSDFLYKGQEKTKFDLQEGRSYDLNLSRKIDLVLFFNSLEYIYDFKKELEFIKENLNYNGIVYIETAGVKKTLSLNQSTFHHHLRGYFFSLRSLTNLMRKYGFNLIYGNEKIHAIFQVNNNVGAFIKDVKQIKSHLNLICILQKLKKYSNISYYISSS